MPYLPPGQSSIFDDVKNLQKVYSGFDKNRKKLRDLILAFADLYTESKYLVGMLIFAAEKINEEYHYLAPTQTPYIFGYGPGSLLYTTIQKILLITEQNPLPDQTRIIYLAKLKDSLHGEVRLVLDKTEYNNTTELGRDIEKMIHNILLRSHPEVANVTASSSYLSYFAPPSALQNLFSSAKPEKPVFTLEYRDVLLNLSDSVISPDKKDAVRQLLIPNEFAASSRTYIA